MLVLKHPLRQALSLIFVLFGLTLQSAFAIEQAHTRLTVAAAKSVDALWALQLDDGEDTAVAAYLTSAAEGEQTTSTFLDQDGKNHPLFRVEDDDYWRPDRYAREALAYSESHDDLLGRTLREKTTRSVWQGVRDKTSETGGALGEQIISDPWGTVKAVGGAIKDDTWEMVRHPIRTAGNIGEGVWTLGKDAAYNLGNSAKSTWAGSFGTENALNTLYGQNMGAPLLGMSAIQASLMAAQVVPAAKGAQALGKGALRAGKTIGEKGLFQFGRGEGVANAGVSGKVADGVVGGNVTKGAGKKIPNCDLCGLPNKRGNAPIGKDGHPVELHHRNQKPDGPLDEMTRTDHRLGDNFKKNHPNTGQSASQIDRKAWRKEQKDYWKKEWDSGDSMTCDGKFTDENSGYSIIFDDDGRVAYAYLLNSKEEITADVWLYNRCATPVEPEWPDPEKMPFANPISYAEDHSKFSGVNDISDLSVNWIDNSNAIEARIFVKNKLFSVLVEQVKPGWCCLAKKDGPLAKVLST